MRMLATNLDSRTDWPEGLLRFEVIWFRSMAAFEAARKLFPESKTQTEWVSDISRSSLLVRHQNLGVMHPKSSSLAKVLCANLEDFEVDEILVVPSELKLSDNFLQELEWSWKEPSIESIRRATVEDYMAWRQSDPQPKLKHDDSWDAFHPRDLGLSFTEEEERVLLAEETRQGRRWTRAEWELFAQTWSEHCKHKIFNAKVKVAEHEIRSIFKTCIRAPSLELASRRQDCLSMFHDNAGVVGLRNFKGEPTEWAVCAKMETHNSPSAISPFGGAATGVVGVHRDILGTGLGAKPIANWNVLCFESDEHNNDRPSNALPPRVIRSGVLRGIEVGGNHSGIPTVQGSVHFDPSFAVKPYVFAGALGLMKTKHVTKAAKPGHKLYCVGGATGVDGVRGAVMSSRSIEADDFVGSAVQVANPFVQRMLTDFLIRARDEGLITSITDNGAGGLASSVGEMALSTNGAQIDLSHLRLKVRSIPAWIRLLSESQERMTVATDCPEAFEALATSMQVEWDRLGELNESGGFKVVVQGKPLVDVSLEFLHEACPRLELLGDWSNDEEAASILNHQRIGTAPDSHQRVLTTLFGSDELCSREGIVRRFDHEVQGRTLKKPYSGLQQKNPSQGSVVEIPEAFQTSVVLSHGAYPEMNDVTRATEMAFFEAASSAIVSGAQVKTLAALDNYAWPDPTSHAQSLFQLATSAKTLETLARAFDVPFVSGKDSMKNNSATFRTRPAALISMFASGVSPELIPTGYVQRPNDIVAVLYPLQASLIDSAFQRHWGLSGAPSKLDYKALHKAPELLKQIRDRLTKMESMIAGGNLRSLRAVGRAGTLGALTKMTIGTSLGLMLHESFDDPVRSYGEGFAGFVMTLDPHQVSEVQATFGDLVRVGVVSADHEIRFNGESKIALLDVESAYQKRSVEGFWK